jgi:hypothetical protein
MAAFVRAAVNCWTARSSEGFSTRRDQDAILLELLQHRFSMLDGIGVPDITRQRQVLADNLLQGLRLQRQRALGIEPPGNVLQDSFFGAVAVKEQSTRVTRSFSLLVATIQQAV